MEKEKKHQTIDIDVEVNGADEALEKLDNVADAMQNIPPQVVVRNCSNCEINIHPSQMFYVKDDE